MRQQNPAIAPFLLVLSILSCTAGGVPGPPRPSPIPEEHTSPPTSTTRYLILSPGIYEYRWRQTAEISTQDSGYTLTPSTTVTTALFYIDISQRADSSYSAVVSVDSLSITAQGSIPTLGLPRTERIDSILHVVLSPALVTFHERLPDSLCAYGHLVATARLILLPELALSPQVASRKTYSDTSREVSCRAGTHIESLTTRQVRRSGTDSAALAIEQKSELSGTGFLRRDSVTVSGSLSARGAAFFLKDSRLASTILMDSEGTITVRLGEAKTIFRQVSNQEIRLRGSSIP